MYNSQTRGRLLLAIVTACLIHGCLREQCNSRQGCSSATANTPHDVTVAPHGADATLTVASWNLDWFGDSTHGPVDEALQLDHVCSVIVGTEAEIWGLSEVVEPAQWGKLESRLSGYAGVLSSDSNVKDGKDYYDDGEQKVGLLYQTSVAELEDARLILTDHDEDFAGRPPLQVTLRVNNAKTTERSVFIVIHPKCCPDDTSWQHRVNASGALKTYLDNTFPTQNVWVIGDFNDDIEESIAAGHPSPYFNFASDTRRYALATRALSEAGVASTVEYPKMIDHHLITNEVNARYIADSAAVVRADEYINDYQATTSDHYPVLSRYYWSNLGSDPNGASTRPETTRASSAGEESRPRVFLNEICANEPGNDIGAEFVELVNAGATLVDIAAWSISDDTGVRHTFGSGTSIPAGGAVVVFGDSAAIPGVLSNATAASSGALGLANSGDSVTLSDSSGAVIDRVLYGSILAAGDGVSMNRSPDGTPNAPFAVHTALSALISSPGKRVDCSNW